MSYLDAKWKYYMRHRSKFPAGYRRVEYIESTGYAYIDTGVIMSSDLAIEVMGNNKYRASNFVRGLFEDNNGYKWSIFIISGGSTPNIQGAYNRTGGAMLNMKVENIAFDSWFTARLENHKLTVNGKSDGTGYYAIPASNIHMYIGGYEFEGQMFTSETVVSTLDMDDNGIAVRRYVPCVRTSDNKPGMYDLCGSICPLTGTPFYVNSGTGPDFTWGEL